MGMNGEGIGKWQDVTFFIKDAVVGDEIEAAVTKMKNITVTGESCGLRSPLLFAWSPAVRWRRPAAAVRCRRWPMGSSWS